MEEFRDIKGYEGTYQVSRAGQVRSLDRKVLGPWGSKINKKGKILATQISPFGVELVDLSLNTVRKKCRVHKLVAQTFGGL